jgi:hypothetical protein
MYTINIPENFARTIAELYGEAGREWLARLPSRRSVCPAMVAHGVVGVVEF